MQLPDHWPWLLAIFGDADSFIAALAAYYMLLSTVEFLDAINQGLKLDDGIHLNVPITYVAISESNQKKSLRFQGGVSSDRDIVESQPIVERDEGGKVDCMDQDNGNMGFGSLSGWLAARAQGFAAS